MPRVRRAVVGALSLTCAACAVGSARAADSAKIPLTNVLLTAWGKAVTPENVWNEYPRPQLRRAEWRSLNGRWDYAIGSAAADEPKRYEGQILVPFGVETPLSGVRRAVTPDDQIWYRRTFAADPRPGRRTLLNFESVDYRAQVFVNGIEATDVPHEGCSTPFSLDVTDMVRKGENELKVVVWDPTDAHLGSTGKQILKQNACFFVPVSGICGSVWCETVPETYLAGYRIDADADTGAVTLTPRLGGTARAAKVEAEALFAGKPVARGGNDGGAGAVTLRLPKPLMLWSCEAPNLYDLVVRVTAGGQTDEARGYFGVRKVETKLDAKGIRRPAVNGRFTYLLGTLDQGWWPDGYVTPPSPDALRFDVDFTKKAGFNTIRKHMKVEPRAFYAYCDRVGIMVVQDLPGHPGMDFKKGNRRYSVFRRELKEIVDHLRNHPCVVMWQPFNEGWGQPSADKTRFTNLWLKRYDPSRLVDGPSGWLDFERGASMPFEERILREQGVTPGEHGVSSDVVDRHYYPMAQMFPPNAERMTMVGEYGGLWACFKEHFFDPRGNLYAPEPVEGGVWRERNRKGYEDLAKPLVGLARKGLGGSFFTEAVDCFWEGGGIVTFDRAIVKVDYEVMRAIHAEVLRAAREAAEGK